MKGVSHRFIYLRGKSSMIGFFIGLAIGLWSSVWGTKSAYENGVIDGARNRFLPKVRDILKKHPRT
jgi:hypothetical protein